VAVTGLGHGAGVGGALGGEGALQLGEQRQKQERDAGGAGLVAGPGSATAAMPAAARASGWRSRLGASGLAPGAHQAVLVGEHDGLDPVAQAELGQNPANVRFDGRLRDEKPLRDLAV
jgi:hypothetical protein